MSYTNQYMRDRIVSEPIRLEWNGWTSDTYRLQHCGWQISVKEKIYDRTMQIALRSPNEELVGLTSIEHFDYFNPTFTRGVKMRIRRLVPEIYISSEPVSLYPIDAEPRYVQNCELREIAHFQKVQHAPNEVLLRKASMEEILEMALERQEPDQERIRKRMIQDQEMKRYGIPHTELKLIA